MIARQQLTVSRGSGGAALELMRELTMLPEFEGRDMTSVEARRFDELEARSSELQAQVVRAEAFARQEDEERPGGVTFSSSLISGRLVPYSVHRHRPHRRCLCRWIHLPRHRAAGPREGRHREEVDDAALPRSRT